MRMCSVLVGYHEQAVISGLGSPRAAFSTVQTLEYRAVWSSEQGGKRSSFPSDGRHICHRRGFCGRSGSSIFDKARMSKASHCVWLKLHAEKSYRIPKVECHVSRNGR